MPFEPPIPESPSMRTTARVPKLPWRKKHARILMLLALVGVVLAIGIFWSATRLTEAERRLVGVWSMRIEGTSFHDKFHLRKDHSYTETTLIGDKWEEVVSGHWDATDSEIRLHQNWNVSILDRFAVWKGDGVAVLQILEQSDDRLVMFFPGYGKDVWTRSEVVP